MVRFGANTKKLLMPWARCKKLMNAPISRVLPTPVARAKPGRLKFRDAVSEIRCGYSR